MTTTIAIEGENRAARRARLSKQRKAERSRKVDTRTGVADDLTVVDLHPTKGLRRISGKRIEAQERITAIYTIARIRTNGKRHLAETRLAA